MTNTNVKTFLKKFPVLLFDMGDTFMFDCDRFSDDEDYQTTYRSLGGNYLTQNDLAKGITQIYNTFLSIGRDPGRYESFPTISDLLSSEDFCQDLDVKDVEIIKIIFALHECGEIPEDSKRVLIRLSESHDLGLISNVWSDSGIFKTRLMDAGVYDLFSTCIFSSDSGCIKPTSQLFEKAANFFKLPCHELVYIGNSYGRDILGAKSVGMNAILVDNGPASKIAGDIKPDYVIGSIEELI